MIQDQTEPQGRNGGDVHFQDAILDSIVQPIWFADHDGLVKFANHAALAALGYSSASDVRDRPSHELIQSRHADGSSFPAKDSAMTRARLTGETTPMADDWFVRSDGSMVEVAHSWIPVDLPEGRGTVCAFHLIGTEPGAPASGSSDEARAAQRRIIEAADIARRRVARDLHDGAQQRIVLTMVNLQLAQHQWGDPAKARVHVDAALEHAEAGREALRDLVAGIHPQILTHLGLSAAVGALADRMPIPVSIDVVEVRMPSALEASLYFFVSEALTNVMTHAHATQAEISLAAEEGRVSVEVRDDGVGGAELHGGGSGLPGLVDRIAALDGEVTVVSPANAGTTLRADVPLPAPPA